MRMGQNGKHPLACGGNEGEQETTRPLAVLPSCPSPKFAIPNWGGDVSIFVQFTKVKLFFLSK